MERNLDILLDTLRAPLSDLAAFVPRLAVALVVVAAGWWLGKLAKFALIRALRAFNMNVLTERAGIDGFLAQGGVKADGVEIFGLILQWTVVLFALVLAFNSMGLTYITDLLTRAMLFVPRLAAGLIILVLGAYFGRFMGNTVTAHCRSAGIQDSELLGGITHYAILAFVMLIALDQMQVLGDIVRLTFLILLAGLVFALALAFGLGGQHVAARMLERWWNRDGSGPR